MSIARCEFHFVANGDQMLSMYTSAEIRRIRLSMLLERYGSLSALNLALGWSKTDPKLSQIKNNNKRPGRDATYQMGDSMAREIEEKLSLVRGWMDNPPSHDELLGDDDPRTKVLALMEQMPKDQWPTLVRLVDALAQPPRSNGTHQG